MTYDEYIPIPIPPPTEEEVIMKTNADIISYLSLALGNVDTGEGADLILNTLRQHSDLLLRYSEKLIQSQRVDIRAVK
jgi:hypothetical protein